MKKIKLYIATSIDGHIARNDGDIDWLTDYPITSELNYGYDEFYNSVDTVLMGGRTYRELLCMDVLWTYRDKMTYVITRNPLGEKENILFISDNVIETISQLRKVEGRDIWLVGGGELTSMLLNNNLIDEMIITTIPIILGSGIPLFPNNPKETNWEAIQTQKYENGIIQTKFVLK